MNTMLTAGVWISVMAVACSQIEGPQRVQTGQWGGEHIALSVETRGATLEFDCAHGTIDEALITDEEGRLSVKGTFTPERGGPETKDEPLQAQPARYNGSVKGSDMELTVVLESGETVGTFRLSYGQRARVVKCR